VLISDEAPVRRANRRDELIESFQATYHPRGSWWCRRSRRRDDVENEELEPDEEIDELD